MKENKNNQLTTMNQPRISIIIPVYNAENQLDRCLQSILVQTYKNLEIILIDDGSIDNSPEICDQYVEIDSRIIVQHTQNQGVAKARNIGLQIFHGDYCMFVDADDMVCEEYVFRLYENLVATGLSVSTCEAYDCVPGNEESFTTPQRQKPTVMSVESYDFRLQKSHRVVWGALFSREVITGLAFDTRFACSTDTLFFAMVLKRCRKHVHTSEKLYCYFYYPLSVSHGLFDRRKYSDILVWQEIQRLYADESGIISESIRDLLIEKNLNAQYLLETQKNQDTQLEKDIRNNLRKMTLDILRSDYHHNNRFDIIWRTWLGSLDKKDKGVQLFIKEHDLPNLYRMARNFCWYLFNPPNNKKVDICIAMPDLAQNSFWGDWYYAQAMKRAFDDAGYQVNVLPVQNWYERSTAKYVIVLRGLKKYDGIRKPGKKYLMWNISHPDMVSLPEYNSYDHVFFASKKMYREYKDKLKCPSSILYQCAETDLMSGNYPDDKPYELLFIGNSRGVYRKIIRDLLPTKHELFIFGSEWEKFPANKYVVSEVVKRDLVGQTYHSAKIVLNDHWDDMRENGIISNRIFDALAAGAFVISDDNPEIKTIFGNSVATYKTREELANIIEHYLSNDVEREKLAAEGKAEVLEKHGFRQRIEAICSVMQGL